MSNDRVKAGNGGSLLGGASPRARRPGSPARVAGGSLVGAAAARLDERARNLAARDRPSNPGNSLMEALARPSPARPVEPVEAREASGLDRLFAGWDAPAEALPTTQLASADEGDGAWKPLIDPMALVSGVVKSRALIAASTVVGAGLGVIVALSTPKAYEAVSDVLIDPRNLQIVERDLTAQGGLPGEATLSLIENQAAIMRSTPVMSAVVDELKLDEDPEFNGGGGAVGIGSLLSMLKALVSGSDGPIASERRHALAVENLAEAVSVDRAGKTFIVAVVARTRDPEKSAEIANTIVDIYRDKAAALQSDNAGRASGELDRRIGELRKDVDLSEREVERYRAEHDLVDAQGHLIGDDELIKLNEQLTVARARTLELGARASSARSLSADAVISGDLPEQVASPLMSQLRSQYSVAAQDAARLASRLGPKHPERIAADAQLRDVRAQIDNELRRIVSSIQVEMKRAVQLEQDLSARLAQLKGRWANVSDLLVTLRELEREAAAKRSVYEQFLLRSKEASQQKDINSANVSVISRAAPPLLPTGPSRAMIAIAGAVLGFAAGIGFGMLRGAWGSLFPPAGAAPGAPRASVSRRPSRPVSAAPAETPAAAPAAPAPEAPALQQPQPAPPQGHPSSLWAAPPVWPAPQVMLAQPMFWPQPMAMPQPAQAWAPPPPHVAQPAPAAAPSNPLHDRLRAVRMRAEGIASGPARR